PATGAGAGTGAGARASAQGKPASGGRSSGWPVMTPPDLPARPVPRAPLTDVVPRRTLIVIAVIVALAVLGTVLALTLGGGDEGGQGAKGGGSGEAVTSQTPSGDTRSDKGDGTRTDGAATESAGAGAGAGASTPGPDDDDAGGSPSSGPDDSAEGGGASAEKTYEGNQGYSIGLPKGWKYQSTGAAGDRFTGPDGQKLLIGWTSTPKDDPVADWKNQERAMVRAQYHRIRIEKVDYRGWNTADWEFTYVESGTKYRAVDRGFVVGDRLGYGLMYTAQAAQWGDDRRKDTWRTLTTSFRPKP
ncbi:serine/threonine protein kinase, partial [Streptomyces sp. G35A]